MWKIIKKVQINNGVQIKKRVFFTQEKLEEI